MIWGPEHALLRDYLKVCPRHLMINWLDFSYGTQSELLDFVLAAASGPYRIQPSNQPPGVLRTALWLEGGHMLERASCQSPLEVTG